MRYGVITCLSAFLCTSSGFGDDAATAQADLAKGARQARAGDYEEALLTLDAVARRLVAEPGRSKDLSQAYLYLGVAYVGLGQERLATPKFKLALEQDPELRLSPEEFPRNVLRSFEAARSATAESEKLRDEASRPHGRKGLLLLGLGGAGAAGIALVVTTQERPNNAPSVSMTIAPPGQAISGVTTMSFTATASDPEGDPLEYTWEFGDGQTAAGPAATHVYASPGAFAVKIRVTDGLKSTTASGSVTVRSLTGTWRLATDVSAYVSEYHLQQSGQNLSATMVLAGPFGGNLHSSNPGLVTDPRTLHLTYPSGPSCVALDCPCGFTLSGQAAADLQSISGTLTCQGCGCGGAITLLRQ